MADAIESQLNRDPEQPRRTFEPYDLRAAAGKLQRVLEGALYDHAAERQEQMQVRPSSHTPSPAVVAEPLAAAPSRPRAIAFEWLNAPAEQKTAISAFSQDAGNNNTDVELAASVTAGIEQPYGERGLGRTGEYFTLQAKETAGPVGGLDQPLRNFLEPDSQPTRRVSEGDSTLDIPTPSLTRRVTFQVLKPSLARR